MTFHARSVIDFGRRFIELSDRLARGKIDAALDMAGEGFGAVAVLLSAECRNKLLPTRHYGVTLGAANDGLLDTILPDMQGPVIPPEALRCMAVSFVDPDMPLRYVLRVFRARADRAFDAEEEGIAELLVAQFAKGMEAASRMNNTEIERALYSDVLDRLQVGVVVLDCQGRPMRISARAQAMLDARDGLQITSGRLRASCGVEDRAFQALLARTATGEDGPVRVLGNGLSLTKRSTERKMGVIVRSVGGGGCGGQANVAVYIRDSEIAPDVEAELVRQIFDLTPAEAAVARRLTDGLSLEETAQSLDISRNTARAHLRSIFSKSGITRQTELVRLVLNSAVVL